MITECPLGLKVAEPVASSVVYRNYSSGWVSIHGTDFEDWPTRAADPSGRRARWYSEVKVGSQESVVVRASDP